MSAQLWALAALLALRALRVLPALSVVALEHLETFDACVSSVVVRFKTRGQGNIALSMESAWAKRLLCVNGRCDLGVAPPLPPALPALGSSAASKVSMGSVGETGLCGSASR